jgi:hypothetical protein
VREIEAKPDDRQSPQEDRSLEHSLPNVGLAHRSTATSASPAAISRPSSGSAGGGKASSIRGKEYPFLVPDVRFEPIAEFVRQLHVRGLVEAAHSIPDPNVVDEEAANSLVVGIRTAGVSRQEQLLLDAKVPSPMSQRQERGARRPSGPTP